MEKKSKEEVLQYSTNYYTCYSCKCKNPIIDYNSDGNACFRAVFDKVQNDVEYKIRICYDPAILLKHKSNYCPLSKEYIVKWLDYLCSICEGRYEIDECTLLVRRNSLEDPIEYPFHEVHFWLNNENNIMHKFVLTGIRFLYEYPFNVFIQDVFRLRCIEKFKDESLLNLFNLIHQSMKYYKSKYGFGHSFSGCAKLIDDDTLKQRIIKAYRLNDIYPATEYYDKITCFEEDNLLDYWEDENKFKENRLPYYEHNYELLCKERDEETKLKQTTK